MRPYPWKCPACRGRKVWPINVDYQVDMDHDGRVYTVHIDQLEVLRCVTCGSDRLPDESYAKLNEELRRMAGLLAPAQIAEKRRSLILSQKEFARLLGVAPETVSRWESGGQLQQRVMNDFMKAFFDLPELREYLRAMRCDAATGPAMPHRVSAKNSTPQSMGHLDETKIAYYQSEKVSKSIQPTAAAGS